MNIAIKNPWIQLNPEQTAELREVWKTVFDLVENDRFVLIQLKLSYKQARLTAKQLYMVAAQLASTNTDTPSWVFDLLEKANP